MAGISPTGSTGIATCSQVGCGSCIRSSRWSSHDVQEQGAVGVHAPTRLHAKARFPREVALEREHPRLLVLAHHGCSTLKNGSSSHSPAGCTSQPRKHLV